MLSTDEKLKLLETAKEAAWVQDKDGSGSGAYDVDKWINTYKTLIALISESQVTSEEIS